MAQQNINYGTPNGQDGDFIRDGAIKIESNFTELYNRTPVQTIYADMAALYADQANQLTNFIFEVTDSSAHPSGVTGVAYFKYNGTTIGDDTDYEVVFKLPTGLERVVESGKSGLRIVGKDPSLHGDIGTEAIDATTSTSSSNNFGATGDYSFAVGLNVKASGLESVAIGGASTEGLGGAEATGWGAVAIGPDATATGNFSASLGPNGIASGSYSVVLGFGQAEGDNSVAIGSVAVARAKHEIALGPANTAYTATNTLTDRLLTLGNGGFTGNASNSVALVVLRNGLATLPSVTNILIDAAGDDTVVTKGWFNANNSGGSETKYSETFGNGSLTTFTITHNLGTEDVIISIQDLGTKEHEIVETATINSNSVSVTYTTAPGLNSKRITII